MSKALVTTAFATAISNADPRQDSAAMEAARVAIIDFLACAIAGANDLTTDILAKAVGVDLPGNAILIGRAAKTDPLTACGHQWLFRPCAGL